MCATCDITPVSTGQGEDHVNESVLKTRNALEALFLSNNVPPLDLRNIFVISQSVVIRFFSLWVIDLSGSGHLQGPNMALSSCLSRSPVCPSVKMDGSRFPTHIPCKNHRSNNVNLFDPTMVAKEGSQCIRWHFFGQSAAIKRPNLGSKLSIRRGSAIHASWLPSSQIASSAFTWGTVVVLPFYASMVVAPQAEFTKKLVASSIPYVFLGTLYAYLLYLSWTPDTIRLMFASKYWLPELPGIATMFSSEVTLSSAWIHLLALDLFAARQVYLEGLQESVETRHSVTLCLMFCPIGILAHIITKAVAAKRGKSEHGIR